MLADAFWMAACLCPTYMAHTVFEVVSVTKFELHERPQLRLECSIVQFEFL